MGRTVVPPEASPNGVKEPLTPESQGPPWWNVDPQAVVADLSRQVAGQAAEMAAMRAYIAQLSALVVQLTGGAVPGENTSPEG